jgi:hypothetical protein
MDDAELLAAVVRALPDVGTQVEYARAALDALEPLLREEVGRKAGAEAVNVLRAKDDRIGELVNQRDALQAEVQRLRDGAEADAKLATDSGFRGSAARNEGEKEAYERVLRWLERNGG